MGESDFKNRDRTKETSAYGIRKNIYDFAGSIHLAPKNDLQTAVESMTEESKDSAVEAAKELLSAIDKSRQDKV